MTGDYASANGSGHDLIGPNSPLFVGNALDVSSRFSLRQVQYLVNHVSVHNQIQGASIKQ
jgi:hypothetical protein